MQPLIESIDAQAYTVPTEAPESDGTASWDSTTLVLVELTGAGLNGLGFTYTSPAAVEVIRGRLVSVIRGSSILDIPKLQSVMKSAVRNDGRPGIASAAIAAVDIALWDLKARLLDLPLVHLLGQARDSIPAYGSGGFTSYALERLQEQVHGWAQSGFTMIKMKVGRRPDQDRERVRTAREAAGPAAELFVDANGAYTQKQALLKAQEFAEYGVVWFEEPVSSDDLAGLCLLHDRAPAGMEIAAGEYGYDATYFRRMLASGAVDVLQADATRCGGITGFLAAGSLCEAFHLPLSAHTAPSVHLHPCCSLPNARHVEYFHDHVRLEQMFFEGAARACDGLLRPDFSRPGLGLELKRPDTNRYRI